MQRPHDVLHLSAAEGNARIERLEHNALSRPCHPVASRPDAIIPHALAMLCGDGQPRDDADGPRVSTASDCRGVWL